MKRYLKFIFLLLILVPTIVYAENLSKQVDSTSTKVYDYADLLTDEEEDLRERANAFIEKYQMDMVILTISENPYGSSDNSSITYAQDFYDYNNFGVGNTKDGVLVLVDMNNRYRYFLTTGTAQLMYDDARINNINNNVISYLKSGNYYQAFVTYISSASSYAKEGVPKSNQYYCIDEDGEYYKCKEPPKSVNWLVTILAASLGSIIPVFVHLRKYKGINIATNANEYLKSSTQNNNVDQFLTTFTSQVRRSHDSGGSGGLGGGSSISHGSSGTSHGGGGGHF